MGLWLKQSTSVDVLIGPFIDDGDGKTTEELLTIEDEHVLLSKNGQALAAKNDATNATHDDHGYYNCPLNGTDTNTLGALQLSCQMAGALPVYHEYMVVRADVYDTMCSTDYLQVDVIQVGGAGEDIATETKQDVIDGNVDNIVADTNELQTDWANGGRLDLILDACALEATVAALNDISVDNVWDEVMDANAPANCNSAREILNVVAAVLAGKSSGGGTDTSVYRDTGDTKNRVSATVDDDGNRDAVGTLDGT